MGAGSRRYLHTDHQGSVVAIADAAGTVVGVNRYDPYGVPSAGNLGRYGYTGQARIDEFGLYYYKARIYHPWLGRFLQVVHRRKESRQGDIGQVARYRLKYRGKGGIGGETDEVRAIVRESYG